MTIKLSDLIDPITGVTRGIVNRNAIGGAIDQIVGGIDAAQQTQQDSLARQNALYTPIHEAGIMGLGKLGDLATNPAQFQAPDIAKSSMFEGSPIAKSALFEKQFTQPTAEQIRATPGYEFELAEAQKAQERSAAARHGLVSGAALKEAARYAGGIADRYSGDEFNKALQTYGLERDLFEGNERIKYGQSVDEYGRQKDLFEGNERLKYGQSVDEYDRRHQIFNEGEDRTEGRVKNLTELGMRGTAGLSGAEQNYSDQITELEKAKADAIAIGDLAKAQELDGMIAGIGNTAGDILGGALGGVAGGDISLKDIGSGIGKAAGAVGGAVGDAASAVGGAVGSAGSAIGGALGSLGALGIPIIGGGLAIAAKLLINSQAHRQADKLTGEGGIQYNLNADLKTLADDVISGKMTQAEADPLRQQTFKAWAEKALEFASGGGDKRTVVRQMLTSYDWDPALKDLAAQFRQRLG